MCQQFAVCFFVAGKAEKLGSLFPEPLEAAFLLLCSIGESIYKF